MTKSIKFLMNLDKF